NRECDGLFYIWLASEERCFKTGRKCHFLYSLLRREAGEFLSVDLRQFVLLCQLYRIKFVSKLRSLRIELEIVEVHVSPSAAFLIDKANENFFAELIAQIKDDWPQAFAVIAGS